MKQSKNLTTNALTDDVKNAVRSLHDISATPRLIADWNLNRYSDATVDNVPSEDDEGADIELFPIESIIEPLRPTKGIIKALVGQATVGSTYRDPEDPKFYVGDEDDVYKYWISPYATDASGNFPLHTDGLTTVRPHVLYSEPVKTNKIVVRVEDTWASPETFHLKVRSTVGTATGTGWVQAGPSSPTISLDGTITLYYNGSAWVEDRPQNLETTDVAGIMLSVDSMKGGITKDGEAMFYTKRTTPSSTQMTTFYTDGSKSNLSLISIEAHFEADLTDRLISVNDTFDMAETSVLYPIGTITTNQGQVTLSNEDGILSQENSTSPYYGLLEPNVEFNLEYIFDLNGAKHSVQQFKMYSTLWAGQTTEQVVVTVDDFSMYLKEVKPRAAMYEGKSATELVWRVLDSVGFNDYEVEEEDQVVEHTIPVFWTDGEKTAWEILDEIAKATQTAIYFDGRGKLQVKTRTAAFKDGKSADWTLLGQNRGTELEDIVTFNTVEQLEANNINVVYKATKWKVGTNGKPAMSKVWEPEQENVVVRSAPLIRGIDSNTNFIWLNKNDIAIWPYSGKVNIGGEVISYEGKRYIYYTYTRVVDSQGKVSFTTPVKHIVNVKSADELAKYNSKTPARYRRLNHLTGGLKITERGVWNTEERNHLIDLAGWSTEFDLVNPDGALRVHVDNPVGLRHKRDENIANLSTAGRMTNPRDTYWATRLSVMSNPFKMFGTKFRFNADAASTTQRGGLCFFLNGARNNGYYVEFRRTRDMRASVRKYSSEVVIYSKVGNRYIKIAKGSPTLIENKIWYEVDVYVANGIQDTISVWVNGKRVAQGVTTNDTKQPNSGKMGMYARGKTNMDFEFVYGLTKVPKEPDDDFGFYDLVYGGMRGGFYEREVVWRLKSRWKKVSKKRSKKIRYRYNDYMFDEFGPIVHEIREFNVKFDPAPVRYSTLFSTNEWYSACVEYNSTPFGADFIMANVGRDNAILHGEDRLVFRGSGNEVQQALVVLGRNLEISDEETITKKNTRAMRARGRVDVELSSDWIQTKAMATSIANWMARHWSEGLDEATCVIFGNPLLEIGDVVEVDFDDKHMSASTHRYFVTGVSTVFDTGIETTLNLRRIRTADQSSIS